MLTSKFGAWVVLCLLIGKGVVARSDDKLFDSTPFLFIENVRGKLLNKGRLPIHNYRPIVEVENLA
ncbi:hypothetical protein B7989_01300 [Fibrobacter sp. UWB5]|nr:hypothetical protein B7989_01300 [Fibrobacter sp. UWB5]